MRIARFLASTTSRILACALLFAITYWVVASVYEYFRFEANLRFMLFREPLTFEDSLYRDVPPHSLFNRISFAFAAFLGGALVAYTFAKYRQRDRELQRSEARLRAFANALPDLGFIFTSDGLCIKALGAQSLLPIPHTRIEGRLIHQLLPSREADHLHQAVVATAKSGQGREVDFDIPLPAGERRFEGRTSAIRDETALGHRLVVLIARDVTDRNVMEESLRQAEKMQAIGELAGGVAHDFNNQLGGILGFADLLAQNLTDEGQRNWAESIRTSARRAAGLTQQLLAYSRKGKWVSAPVDLHEIVHEVVGLLRHSIDKRITLKVETRADRSVTTGDPTQLQSAILNLALNARDAMPDGGELSFLTCNPEPTDGGEPPLPTGPCVSLRIRDTGVGMDAETQRRMFEPFFTTKSLGEGTGMGLAAVYGTVTGHKGQIRVESERDRGTTIEILLPTSHTPREEADPAATAAVAPAKARILVVDDEAVVREVAAELLTALGYRVETAENGCDALALYENDVERYDLVLLDLVMPRLSGHDTFHRLKKIDPEVRVLLNSGYSPSDETEHMLTEGLRGFVQKPFEMKELGNAVAAALQPQGR